MSTLKVGDRVRVTMSTPLLCYENGDKGTVISGPTTSISGNMTYYLVRMDENPAPTGVTFFSDEFERVP
jgi:hypothetical protein